MSEFTVEPVKVLFHLNEGFTKISLDRFEGVGLADGGIFWDIPTEKIPHHLRKIGSSFSIIVGDSVDQIKIIEKS